MTLDKLEQQVVLWSRMALLVPIVVSGLLGILYFCELYQLRILFFIACGLYFATAVIWWWWTMKSIHLLVRIMKTANEGISEVSDELKKELTLWIRQKIGPIATPDKVQFAPGLPKTRSGKIMRRILRKIASHEEDQLGDTSTLADPGVVQSLIDGSKNI